MAGLFITLEGGDGVGKTTQFELLARALREAGHDVVTLHEPGGTRVGERIRSLLLDKELGELDPVAELLLFEAARAQIVAEVIEPALAAGKTVLCDRFSDSTVAYQGYGRELGAGLCAQLNAIATAGREPDLTILLTLDQQEAVRRVAARAEDGEGDRMETAGSAFRQRVNEGFAALAEKYPQRIHMVDAAGSIEEVHARIMKVLQQPCHPERSAQHAQQPCHPERSGAQPRGVEGSLAASADPHETPGDTSCAQGDQPSGDSPCEGGVA